MQITNGFKIKDIIEYETINKVDIRKQLSHGDFTVVIELIAKGNSVTTDDAMEQFKELIKSYTYEEIVQELAIEVFGRQAESDDEIVDSNNKSFTEILTSFYNEIQTLDNNLSISEFMGMNTSFMYKYAEGIKSRYIFNKNKELRDEFENIAMLMGVLDGKIKKAPQVKESDFKTAKQIKEERIQEMRERRQQKIERGEI